MIPSIINLDIELTNRCNADCYFCPRDPTPHQGTMSAETFARSLERAIEFRDSAAVAAGREMRISLCGLGEPLLNPRAVDCVRMVRDAGFRCAIASNGSVLTEKKAIALLDAGLQEIDLNVGEEGEEYEAIYGLPFQRTLDNVVRFAELAEGRCKVNIVLVDHREDEAHRAHMKQFWQDRGLSEFVVFPIMNRGGALQVERMDYAEDVDHVRRSIQMLQAQVDAPICMAPFVFLFIGYDGKYYLCCADWKKEAAYGTVFDAGLADVLGPKLRATRSRELVCHTCNIDPVNILADTLRAYDRGEATAATVEATVEGIRVDTGELERLIESIAPGLTTDPAFRGGRPRRLIPLSGS